MSARIVAVTRLLLDVLAQLEEAEAMTPSEGLLADLLHQDLATLQRINALAVVEMQALAPGMLLIDGEPCDR